MIYLTTQVGCIYGSTCSAISEQERKKKGQWSQQSALRLFALSDRIMEEEVQELKKMLIEIQEENRSLGAVDVKIANYSHN